MKPGKTLFQDDFSGPGVGKNAEYQGWSVWQIPLYGEWAVSRDEKEGRDGKGCLSVLGQSMLTPQSAYAFQKFFPFSDFEPGKSYKVSVWIKTNRDLRERVRLIARFKTQEGDDNNNTLGKVHGSGGQFMLESEDAAIRKGQWEERSLYFTVPEEGWSIVARILCQLVVQKDGAREGRKLWFDDFAISEVSLPSRL